MIQPRSLLPALAACCLALLLLPAAADGASTVLGPGAVPGSGGGSEAPGDGPEVLLGWNPAEGQRPGAIPELPLAGPEAIVWSDSFDSYATGSQLHGQGGWKGWFNDPTAGALTSSAQARSAPNSAAIAGTSDLVHEYAGANSGLYVYTAWQYVPSTMTGEPNFILLNTYNDAGVGLNWSVQVAFNGSTNLVTNTGATGGTLPLVEDQWVQIRIEIDLTNDLQVFYYDNQVLYTGTWTDEVSGGGALNIGAVDLFADVSTTVYYDDMSLATGEPALSIVKTVGTDADQAACAPTSSIEVDAGTTVYYCYTVYNTGNLAVNSHDLVDSELGALLTNYSYLLHPGTSARLPFVAAVIDETTVNVATWSAESLGGGTAESGASATVLVRSTNVLLEIPTLSGTGLALFASALAGLAGVLLFRRRTT